MDNINNINTEILNSLSPEERKLALSILQEYTETGKSDQFTKLLYDDYAEIPVDIDTFLHDNMYLGKGLINDEGKFTVFPYWEKKLKEIFPNNIDTAYNTVILSGAIGLGKSFIAVICMLYMLYRMLCLKDPYKHYGLQPIDHITFSLMNITLDAAKGVAWSKIQELLKMSPWFMNHGRLTKAMDPEWQPNQNIELIYGSQPRHVIGRAVFCSFEDEISFIPTQDVEKQKEKAKALISSIDARMQSRFMKGSKLPTLHLLASSKRTDQSFLEVYIDMKKKNDSKTTLVVDEPQWVIRTDKDSKEKFCVAVGNKFLDSEVLPLGITEKELQLYRDKGFSILRVPIGYHENFLDDIDIALTDIAGISTSNSMSYISGVRWSKCRKPNLKNPFTKEIITVGDDPEDKVQYYDFFDLSKVPNELKSKPLFVHLDMSMSGDKTGIGGVWIKGKKPHQEGVPDSKELYYRLAFSVSIKAPKGHQVSFEKNRQFIYWLRDQGFNVRGVSYDTFQSADLAQQLKARKFDCDVISVDRLVDKVCKPYLTFKNAIYEERIETYETTLLTDEIIGLVRDGNGKIDHSPAGINCFTGDTKIRLVDGRSLSFTELLKEYEEGKSNWVYSLNLKDKKVEPKEIKKVWCSGISDKIVKITLDNGEFIECTPEHRFMLRNGEYIEAQNLIPGDSLMPLYTKYPDKGALTDYRMYYEPFEDKWHYEHRQFAKDVMDEKYLVHHKDLNPNNNCPNNLVWCSKETHQKLHSNIASGCHSKESKLKKSSKMVALYKNNPEWVREKNLKIKAHYEEHPKNEYKRNLEKNRINRINSTFGVDYNSLNFSEKISYAKRLSYMENPEIKENMIKHRKESIKIKNSNKDTKSKAQLRRESYKEISSYYGVDWGSLSTREKIHYGKQYSYIQNPENKNKIIRVMNSNNKNAGDKSKRLRKLFPNVDREEFKYLFKFDYDSLPNQTEKMIWTNRYRQKLYELKNHKVVKIEFLDKKAKVYDMEIPDNHNFALDSGVFVHNSKDSSDGVCGALYNASLHAEEFAYDYGESLEQIIEVNNNIYDEDKRQLTLDLEEELKNMGPVLRPKSNDEGREDYNLYSDILIW